MDLKYAFTEFEIGGNTVWRIIAPFAIILLALLVGKIIKCVLQKSATKFESQEQYIMAIYWYHPPNYWDFMAFSERFNKAVFQKFQDEGIDFAFPTQTVCMAGDSTRPLNVGVHHINDLSSQREA